MNKLIEIKGLNKIFPIRKGFFNRQVGGVKAVNNISLDIYKGETLGLVGESGCGKSTAGRCIPGLINPTSGSIYYNGENIIHPANIQKYRSKLQIIFQNPYSSLNPRMSVREILEEPLIINKTVPRNQINKHIDEFMNLVGLSSAALNRYPHEFSGGQRQRIGIARALILKPDFIVADEPVSALDVSIQAQIINLLEDIKKELGLTYLFISHDLSVVRHVSNRTAVMYLGEIVEIAPAGSLFITPQHPYTKALLSSVPVADPKAGKSPKIVLKGDVPDPANPPSGCKFHTRCPQAMDICTNIDPEFTEIISGHIAKCHLLNHINL